MDCDIFTAARDGKLRRLKMCVEQLSKDDVAKLVSAKTEGATPLVVACRNGHHVIVEYLIEHCGADVEQVGSVTFDGDTIEGAPPLWCASAAGNLGVVRSLLKLGANVNSVTKTNSTPLRAACFDGHLEIVKYLVCHEADIEVANRHGHTCLMIACYKGHYKIASYLIELGADVNRKSVKGNTALHDCAESGSLAIMKLLLQNGAKMDVDSYGMTPLLAASLTGHAPTVEYLINLPFCSRGNKINALELLGATYVDKQRDMLGALKYWRRAIEDRINSDEEDCLRLHDPLASVAYGNAKEIVDLKQLETLAADPDEMRMQALLIRERILGPAHPDTSYYIRYRGAVYADAGNFDRCILLWMYALDMQQKILGPLSQMTQSSLLSFAELFSFMVSEVKNRTIRVPPVKFDDIMAVFVKAILEVEVSICHMDRIPIAERDSTHFNRTLIIVMHFVCLLARLQPTMSDKENWRFHKVLYKFIHLNPRGRNGWTPLHLACSSDSSLAGRYPLSSFPSYEVIKLLLEVGASLQDVDYDHNTPLHIVASSKPYNQDVIKLLLNHGAHVDACNLERKSFLNLIAGEIMCDVLNPLDYRSLQCLAASVIVEHGIPYELVIPHKLIDFVKMH
ncbi:hypothetical protein CHUAL_000433 [Chamberlinius hualienensis]